MKLKVEEGLVIKMGNGSFKVDDVKIGVPLYRPIIKGIYSRKYLSEKISDKPVVISEECWRKSLNENEVKKLEKKRLSMKYKEFSKVLDGLEETVLGKGRIIKSLDRLVELRKKGYNLVVSYINLNEELKSLNLNNKKSYNDFVRSIAPEPVKQKYLWLDDAKENSSKIRVENKVMKKKEYLTYIEKKDLKKPEDKELASKWQNEYNNLSLEVGKIMSKYGNRIPSSKDGEKAEKDNNERTMIMREMRKIESKAKGKFEGNWIFD